MWQKILKVFQSKQESTEILTDERIQKFISNPETFILYRGESKGKANEKGLHFTTDKDWAKSFGDTLLMGSLPKGSIIHHIDQNDFTEAMDIYSRIKKIDDKTIFELQLNRHGYDAMIGHDPMNSNVLDVVVHTKHLSRFRVIES